MSTPEKKQATNSPSILSTDINTYLQLRREVENTPYKINLYENEASILNTIDLLCSPDYRPIVSYNTEQGGYIRDDGGKVSRDNKFLNIRAKLTFGSEDNSRRFGYSSYSEETKLVARQEDLSNKPLTVSDRMLILHTLIDNEFNSFQLPDSHGLPDNISHSLNSLYEIITHSVNYVKNLDLEKVEQKIISQYQNQCNQLVNMLAQLEEEKASILSQTSFENIDSLFLDNEFSRIKSELAIPHLPQISAQTITDDIYLKVCENIEKGNSALTTEYKKIHHKIADPPLNPGERRIARVTKKTIEGKTFTMVDIPDVQINETETIKEIGHFCATKTKEKTVSITYSLEIEDGHSTAPIFLSAGQSLAEPGDYPLELHVGDSGGKSWRFALLTSEFLEREKKEIIDSIKRNLPLRKLAQPLNLNIKGYENVLAMPVDKDGQPCDPAIVGQVDHWELYMKDYLWKYAYPDAYIISHYKGDFSQKKAPNFLELKKEFSSRIKPKY